MVRIPAPGRDRHERVARCRRRCNLLGRGATADFHFDLDLSPDTTRELGQPGLRVRFVKTLGGSRRFNRAGHPLDRRHDVEERHGQPESFGE